MFQFLNWRFLILRMRGAEDPWPNSLLEIPESGVFISCLVFIDSRPTNRCLCEPVVVSKASTLSWVFCTALDLLSFRRWVSWEILCCSFVKWVPMDSNWLNIWMTDSSNPLGWAWPSSKPFFISSLKVWNSWWRIRVSSGNLVMEWSNFREMTVSATLNCALWYANWRSHASTDVFRCWFCAWVSWIFDWSSFSKWHTFPIQLFVVPEYLAILGSPPLDLSGCDLLASALSQSHSSYLWFLHSPCGVGFLNQLLDYIFLILQQQP